MLNKMFLRIIFVLIALLLIAIGVMVLLNAGKMPLVEGSSVTINSGLHHMKGTLAASADYQYLLKDKGVSIGTFSGDAFITMLSYKTAEQLRAKYGDFFKCNDPGAIQAMQKMQATILVAGDKKSKQSIQKAMRLVRQSRIPVVRFTGAELRINQHTYIGMTVNDGTYIPIYYVTNFNIVKADYLK